MRGQLTVGCLALNQVTEVRILPAQPAPECGAPSGLQTRESGFDSYQACQTSWPSGKATGCNPVIVGSNPAGVSRGSRIAAIAAGCNPAGLTVSVGSSPTCPTKREWRNGRRARLRTVCPQGRGGSTPLSRTSPYSSVRQSSGLLNRRSKVRILLGAPGSVAQWQSSALIRRRPVVQVHPLLPGELV